MGYFPSWSRSPAAQIPAHLLTQVIYAFALPGEDGSCALQKAASERHLPAFAELKRRYPHLQILVSIGGSGTAKAYSKVVESPESIQSFARACAAMMVEGGFDGLDIDWEYPTAAQKARLTDLVRAARRELDLLGERDQKRYLLTLAAPAGPWSMLNMELDKLAPQLDWFNLMTYNYYGSWSQTTGFNAPLYTLREDPQQLSLDTTVRAYLFAGVPAAKLLVGIPFYGRAWGGVAPGTAQGQDGIFQPYDPQSKDIRPTLDYIDIKAAYLEGASYGFHPTAKVPWLYHPQNKTFISFDDPQSVAEKARYARLGSLGGVMIWQLSGDDDQRSLLRAAAEGLGMAKPNP